MKKIFFVILFAAAAISISAQTKTRKPKKASVKTVAAVKPTTVKQPTAQVETPTDAPVKKNERPAEETAPAENPATAQKANQTPKSNARPSVENKFAPVYFYTFSQPQFLISKILIEHDETGAGRISFQKRDIGDLISDPIQLSPAALERIETAFGNLNFLDSKEAYQAPNKNFAHLGTMTVAEKKDGRERQVEFNWTENKDAKALADEYRKIGEQFIWIFDMNVARQNQQLETPSLIDALESMIKRNEIADAAQMLPLLRELSTDERLPLIARNQALRIIKDVEKSEAKKSTK